MSATKKLSNDHSDLLRKNGRFPDDFIHIGTKDGKIKFKNRHEGFVIELNASKEEKY